MKRLLICRLKILLLLFLSLIVMNISTIRGDKVEDLLNPLKLRMFVDELVEMPKLQGFSVVNGLPKPKTLDIGMFNKEWKFHRDLPPTWVFAYGESRESASVPGPTIEALQGIETRVRWRNELPEKHILPWDPTIPTAIPSDGRGVPTVVHLHGGIEEPASDGNADAWFTRGFSDVGPTWSQQTYRYRNLQHPGSLWYHDHAMGLTRVNLLAGLLGAYVIRHQPTERPLALPPAPHFDRILLVFDRSFRVDGSIYMNATGNNPGIHPQWQPEYFGDAIIVNGKAWPTTTVRRRRYRFRIINASNARFFRFFFLNAPALRFIHVGSDSAYLNAPVRTKHVLLAPSEIADVVVDFSKSKSGSVVLGNDAPYPYPGGDPVNEANGKVMKFVVVDGSEVDTSRVPNKLMNYPRPRVSETTRRRYITMYEYASDIEEPTHLYLNGMSYEERVTERAKVGSKELWWVINLTEDNHPLHIHLALFAVVEQRELLHVEDLRACMTRHNDAVKCHISKHARGKRVKVPRQERGWKNVFKMRPGFVTKIVLWFSYIHHPNASYPFDATADPGYVYHCHILDHEDNAMMRPLKMVR